MTRPTGDPYCVAGWKVMVAMEEESRVEQARELQRRGLRTYGDALHWESVLEDRRERG